MKKIREVYQCSSCKILHLSEKNIFNCHFCNKEMCKKCEDIMVDDDAKKLIILFGKKVTVCRNCVEIIVSITDDMKYIKEEKPKKYIRRFITKLEMEIELYKNILDKIVE